MKSDQSLFPGYYVALRLCIKKRKSGVAFGELRENSALERQNVIAILTQLAQRGLVSIRRETEQYKATKRGHQVFKIIQEAFEC